MKDDRGVFKTEVSCVRRPEEAVGDHGVGLRHDGVVPERDDDD